MLTTLIFDLDGTLLHTLPDIADAMNRALALHGLPVWPEDAYRMMVGNGARRLAERAVGSRVELTEAVLADYQAWYETHCREKTCSYPGIREALAAFGQLGLDLCVLSNKPDQDAVNVVRHYFPEVPWRLLRGQLPGVPVKPDPTAVTEMLRTLGAAREECLFIGDSCVDIQTAIAAGIPGVGAAWGFRGRRELEEAGARWVLDRPEELTGTVRSLLG